MVVLAALFKNVVEVVCTGDMIEMISVQDMPGSVGIALAFVLVLSLAAMGSAGDGSSDSNANIEQNANVDGDRMEINQESHVTTSDGDNTVEEHSEQRVTKESGEDAEVERSSERFVDGEEDETGPNIEQNVDEDDGSLSVSQQHSTDATGADTTEPDADTDADTVAEVEAEYGDAESAGDTVDTAEAGTDAADTEVSPLRQGGSLAIVQNLAGTVMNALTGLFR